MKRLVLHTTRGLASMFVIGCFGVLTLIALPALVQAQDAPAAECDAGPHVVCPAVGDPAAQYVGSVT
ncbi:MAG: hypothetical protein KC438_08450, partial [Thermomicrobiales bacterium]|nr:hypothetical protein [Thermomicrobiales bacterium]